MNKTVFETTSNPWTDIQKELTRGCHSSVLFRSLGCFVPAWWNLQTKDNINYNLKVPLLPLTTSGQGLDHYYQICGACWLILTFPWPSSTKLWHRIWVRDLQHAHFMQSFCKCRYTWDLSLNSSIDSSEGLSESAQNLTGEILRVGVGGGGA